MVDQPAARSEIAQGNRTHENSSIETMTQVFEQFDIICILDHAAT